MTYYSNYFQITHYCKACNDPPGTNETKSGEKAYKGSCAVSYPLFKKYDGMYICLQGLGNYYINDYHGKGNNIVDIYDGDMDYCRCDENDDNKKTFYGEICFD